MRWLLIALLYFGFASSLFAQSSDTEQRARHIGEQLRCVVCQNQSIEESDAQLAGDMRRVVREQLATGASDAEVISYIRESYGDYVLLKPPLQSNTYILWFLPILLVLASLIWFWRRARQRDPQPQTQETIFTQEDETLLNKLLSDET